MGFSSGGSISIRSARCPRPRRRSAFWTTRPPTSGPVLIDRLLERPEFADYWAMKWSDLLRVKAEFPINLWPNAAQAYHRWIRTSLKENMPYDRFVRELLTACGSNFRTPQVNFYRALQSKEPPAIAQAVALAFMGVRAESWPKERWAGMGVFFSQVGYKPTREWKEEIVVFDPHKAKTTSGRPAACRRLSRRDQGRASAGAGSAGGVCRLADRRQEPLVCPAHRQPGVVLAPRDAASFTSRTTFGPTTRHRTSNC